MRRYGDKTAVYTPRTRLRKTSTPSTPQSWTSSSQNCKKINVCGLSCPGCTGLWPCWETRARVAGAPARTLKRPSRRVTQYPGITVPQSSDDGPFRFLWTLLSGWKWQNNFKYLTKGVYMWWKWLCPREVLRQLTRLDLEEHKSDDLFLNPCWAPALCQLGLEDTIVINKPGFLLWRHLQSGLGRENLYKNKDDGSPDVVYCERTHNDTGTQGKTIIFGKKEWRRE